MHAAVITGKERVELLEFPRPEPRPDGAVVDIELCGICGTDVHAFQSGEPYTPAICGHEWTGTVSAVGAEVRRLQEGDRVVVGVPPACGRCDACRAGHAGYCTAVLLTSIGRGPGAPPHGGFAPQIATTATRLIPVGPTLTSVQAAQVEPATVAFHAVRHTQPHLGDVVVVQGAGPIGLVTLQVALAGGAGSVVVVEPNAARRELALALGATYATHPDDAATLVAELSHGLGADVVYECVGRTDTVQQAVGRARRGGRMCLIGLANEHAPIDPTVWLLKEIQVSAALAYTHDDFDRTMGMIADGRIVLDPIHTSTVGLTAVGAVIADLASGTSTQTKVLVDPRL
jgi:(R,R)-butanediol dehydrogenase/meso-butanediol dehydrogenase/diacetyl reductase